jgi:hypothetical protein
MGGAAVVGRSGGAPLKEANPRAPLKNAMAQKASSARQHL